ncbi:thiol reductant ABC exporter subunit CydD [Pseudochelatococcus sp. B33]
MGNSVSDDTVSARLRGAGASRPVSVPARPAGSSRTSASAQPGGRPLQAGAILQTLAALCWIPQAACLAWAVGALAGGAGARAILPLAVALLLLGLLRAGLDARGGRLAFRHARDDLSRLRAAGVQALARRSPFDRGRPASGEAASVIAEQADAVLPYLSRYRPARGKATVVPLAILAAVLPFSWVAALILLLAAPLIPLFMALIGLKAREASEAQMLEIGGMNAFLLDRLRGLATIRAMDAVDATATRLRASAERLRTRTMAVLRVAFLSSAVLELFSALGVAMVAVYVGFHFLGSLPFGAWGGKLTLTEGLFILLLAPAFFEPLRELAAVWHDRAAGVAALDALDRLSQPAELPLPCGIAPAHETVAHPPAVAVERLVFGYGGERPAIDGLSLHVGAGEKIAITGASGSGKSTLLALIAGLVAADAGGIVVGGVALTDETAARLRARMAWVGQKPHLFAGSMDSNVALGRPGIGRAEIDSAIGQAALAEVVRRRRPGAPVGEGGAGLSGGEALRLALARAAADPRADIILADEPTAHLDPETAAQVRAGLLRIAQGRTLIVATHDPVLMADMDRIVTLDRGVTLPAGRQG